MSRVENDLNQIDPDRDGRIGTTSNEDMLRRTLSRDRRLRVCVVGAGVAGLRASELLLRHGVDVTIYEARKRIGGRVAQSNLQGHAVDLGPNWLHGTKNNPIMDLATRTGTALHFWDERQIIFDESGSKVADEDVREVSEVFWGIISDAFKYSNENSESIPVSMSLLDFVTNKAQEKFIDEPDAEDSKLKRRLLLRQAEMWGAFVGGLTSRQSLKYFWLEECLEGENPFVAGTYQKILERIAEPVLEKVALKLEQAVTRISTDVQSDGSSASIVVETSNGTVDAFDEVIFTAPLGWLKRNTDIFSPPLPAPLTKAIGSVGYGSLDKVYITFPSAWWDVPPTNGDNGTFSNPQEHNAPNLRGPLHATSDSPLAPNGEQDKHYPGFTNWCNPNYAVETNPYGWAQECINLAALPTGCAHPTLLFYIFGPCAQHVADLVSHSPNAAQTTEALIAFFKPYFSRLPHYAPESAACTPTGALATAWTNDEWAGYGSYTNFQIGLDGGNTAVETMRKGLPERRLWFAGEHTAPFVALGTVTGAWWSGEGVSKRICQVYELKEGQGRA